MVFKIIYSVMLLYAHSLKILVKTSVILHKCYVVCAYVVIILVDLLSLWDMQVRDGNSGYSANSE